MAKKKFVGITIILSLFLAVLSAGGFLLLRKDKVRWEKLTSLTDRFASKCVPDRSYYTTEPEIKLICIADVSKDSSAPQPSSIDVVIVDRKESNVAQVQASFQGPRTLVPIPISNFPIGDYSAVAIFRDSNGNHLSKSTARFQKLPPAPSTEVKIDYDNEVILVDGKPFFPLGYLIVGRTWSQELMEKISSGGFNCLVRWQNLYGKRPIESLPEIVESLDRAYAAGIKVFEAPFAFGPDFYPTRNAGDLPTDKGGKIRQAILDSIRTPMQLWKDHPAIIGYYGLDEPEPDLYFFTRQIYDRLKTHDPYRLVYATNWQPWEEVSYEVYDVLGRQSYWMPLSNTYPNSTLEVSQPSVQMRMLAERFHRPFIGTPQACWREEVRKITPQEMRCSYYLPIIHGAKGLLVFWYNDEEMHPVEWKAATKIAKELGQLAPILLKKSPPQMIVSSLSNRSENNAAPVPNRPIDILPDFKPIENITTSKVEVPVIQALAKNISDGEIIIVSNSKGTPYHAVFNLSTIVKNTEIRDFFNPSKQYKPNGTTFTDSLEGYAVRVYHIKKSKRTDEDEPVRMSINASPINDLTEHVAISTSQNLLLNASFEEATYFGKPDAWFVNPWTDNPSVNTRIDKCLVKGDAVDGEYAVRSGWWESWENRTFFQVGKQDFSKDYVFSIYLKADRLNVPFTLYFEKPSVQGHRAPETPTVSKKIVVGTEWKRYVLPVPLKEKGLTGEHIFQVSVQANGVCNVLADCAQLEVGLQPTPFKRDTYRATPIDKEYLPTPP
ncbi:MAG: hypothetical protein HGB19_08415 [Chlorobiales bacterium]|nr:hypothetical protein [Chlorobiales bacterium]